jgi:hypothetical protein
LEQLREENRNGRRGWPNWKRSFRRHEGRKKPAGEKKKPGRLAAINRKTSCGIPLQHRGQKFLDALAPRLTLAPNGR